jgi:DNA-binding Lrp family transcriptional regulator
MTRSAAHSNITLDDVDASVINLLQDGFPLVPRPFAVVGEQLGLSEAEVMERVRRLREAGVLTRFGPFFDAAAMGGALCLCAMAVPVDRFEEVATMVNAHHEVAHNYERAHRLNMWFVLATQTPEKIDVVAREIATETGLHVLRLPKLEEFFIGFKVAA